MSFSYRPKEARVTTVLSLESQTEECSEQLAEDRVQNKWTTTRNSFQEKMRSLPKEGESKRTKPNLLTGNLLMNFIRIMEKNTKSQRHLDEWVKEEGDT